MALAAARMISSVTWFSQTYQLFQPMCGVRARVSRPQTILSVRSAAPLALEARRITVQSPRSLIVPVMKPGGRVERQAGRQALRPRR